MGRTNKDRHDNDDDFVDMDSDFDEDVNYDTDFKESRLVDKKKRPSASKKKRTAHRPLNWEDDWVDPADDIMFGFSK